MRGDPRAAERAAEREFALRSLDDLDAERAAGDISEEDHRALSEAYTARAAAALRDTEHRDAPPPATARRDRPLLPVVIGLAVVAFALLAGLLVAHGAGRRLPGQPATGSITPLGATDEVNQALSLVQRGRFLDAIKTLDAALRREPANAPALAYRGWLLRIVGVQAHDQSLIDKGFASIQAAERADPSFPDAHFFAAEVLLQDRHDLAAAVPELRAFLASSPPERAAAQAEQELRAALAELDATSTTAGTSPTTGS